MKTISSLKSKSCLALLAAATAWLGLGQFKVQAQGTIYISNQGESGAGYAIGNYYQSFQTGTATGGYDLNAITLLMGDWLGNASGFTVALYNDAGGQPGVSLGTLSGSNNPMNAGQYNYTASGLVFAPASTYWVGTSMTATQPLGGYAWQFTSSQNYASNDGWSISTSVGGSSLGNGDMLQFGVTATGIPEPTALSLGMLGAVVLRRMLRLRKTVGGLPTASTTECLLRRSQS